jgi:hypothetical protein
MAAERDQAGSSGPGMSGTGRDAGGMNAGTSGSSSMGDRGLGSAEVHTGLHSGGGDKYSGLGFAGGSQDTSGGRLRGVADAVSDRIPEGVRNLGSRVSGATAGVRDRLGGVSERASGLMESRGMLDRLRENPLPVLGVAFALGFLLSGNDDDDDGFEPSRASTARRELRSALMAGVTAGIAQGARGFLGQASSEGSGFLNTLLDNLVANKGGASASTGTPRTGGTGGGSYGGSSGGASRGGSTGGAAYGGSAGGASRSGGTAGRPGSYSGGTASRPPSHQEY